MNIQKFAKGLSNPVRVHAAAYHGIVRHWIRMLILLIAHILLRALAFFPFFVPVFFPNAVIPFLFQALFCFLVYAFLVFPLRFRTAAFLCSCIQDRKDCVVSCSYGRTLAAGLFRMLTGALWSIPLIACLYELNLYVFVLDASKAGDAVSQIGERLSGLLSINDSHMLGVAVVILVFLLSLILAVYGWRRGVCFDFLVCREQGSAYRRARSIRKKAKFSLFRNGILNFIILLLPVYAFMTILAVGLKGYSEAMLALQLLFSAGIVLQPDILEQAIIAFLLLYLPFVLYRKARNAAVVVYYDEQCG